MKKAQNLNFEDMAEKLLSDAKEKGIADNYLFVTTFDRYKTQILIMQNLKQAIEEDGTTVTKEYVKGRQNVYTNPAITEYNKTATASNGTVTTLLNIIKSLPDKTPDNKLKSLFDDLDE